MKQQTTLTGTFTSFPANDNWVKGACSHFTFCAKLYDDPSDYGLNGGRVSKLEIRDEKNKVICNYDRGFDLKPRMGEQQRAFHAIMHLLENSPKRFN